MDAGKFILTCALLAALALPLSSKEEINKESVKKDTIPVQYDEVYLNDGTVLKGNIIQVLSDRIEYDPEGPSVYNEIPRSRIVKIIYADGRPSVLASDEIATKDGKSFRCTIVRITPELVIYRSDGSTEEKSLLRSTIKRIRFFDGTAYPSKLSSKKGGTAGMKTGSRTFLASWVRIAHFAGTSIHFSGHSLEKKELRLFHTYLPDLNVAHVYPNRKYKLKNLSLSGGADLDIYFPGVNMGSGPSGRANFGFKAGIRARWGHTSLTSTIIAKKYLWVNERVASKGQLMWYEHASGGPVLNFTCTPKGGDRTLILSVFATFGALHSGWLMPGAALHNSSLLQIRMYNTPSGNVSYLHKGNYFYAMLDSSNVNTCRLKGFTIRMGIGPEIAGGKRFPLIFGMHFSPSYTRLMLERTGRLYNYSPRVFHLWELNWEFTVGIHI